MDQFLLRCFHYPNSTLYLLSCCSCIPCLYSLLGFCIVHYFKFLSRSVNHSQWQSPCNICTSMFLVDSLLSLEQVYIVSSFHLIHNRGIHIEVFYYLDTMACLRTDCSKFLHSCKILGNDLKD